ncbi:MAG: mechanosensitive ion channel family protein [Candidatus Endonucleobacter bathymodioli]|uniref:Mechanosensitive ion channel family protein n=1 Tax=Candidatus Endonucleibacter bathymodioli TaxID=539814 RepID=A0AA90SDV5_9GAMM|nr:mechanosensitive ion channel family protein [Candidatus Endonucleobacter bathymodioli]
MSPFLQEYCHVHIPWISQFLVIIILTFALSYMARRFLAHLSQRVDIKKSPYINAIVKAARLPLSLSIWIIALGWILNLTLTFTDLPILHATPLIQRIAIILLLAWFLLSLINSSYRNLQANQFSGSTLNANTAEVLYKISHLLIIIAFSMMLLQSAGISISGLLAFGGIGGLAVGLAAKDMLTNLFGGLVLYLDRPFHVGEKIKVMGSDVEGWVEEIGWRKTRIRNYERQPIYVPNGMFGNSAVINPSRITSRRIKQFVGLRYQDLNSLQEITKEITWYIHNCGEIDLQKALEVRLIGFGASSIDIQIYCFAACTQYEDFLRIQENILLHTAQIIHKHGADIAFPTRTLDIQWPSNKNSNTTPDGEIRTDC